MNSLYLSSFQDLWEQLVSLIKSHPALGVVAVLTLIAALLVLILFFGFIRDYFRFDISGCCSFVVGLVLLCATFNPVAFASLFPKPWNIVFWIAWGIFILLWIINIIKGWGEPKTVLSVSSETQSIRIVSHCIFCLRHTTNVIEHTIHEKGEENGMHSYSVATYPFPAHFECYYKSLDKDGSRAIFLGTSTVYAVIAAITNMAILKGGNYYLEPLTFNTLVDWFVLAGTALPIVALGLLFWLLIVGFNTEDMIKGYCKKHKKK